MEAVRMKQKAVLFLFVCLGLGALAELSFLHGRIGLSYLVFMTGFYLIFFLRFRLSYNHRRIGLLFMLAIWILAGSYLFYDNVLFYNLNLFILPLLVLFHIVLVTAPNKLKWAMPSFMKILWEKLEAGIKYSFQFCAGLFESLFKNVNIQLAQTLKRILVGLGIGIPLLLVITGLLMSADAVFQEIVLRLPQIILELNFLEGAFRFLVVIVLGLLFFGLFQVLQVRIKPKENFRPATRTEWSWDSITAVTTLIMLNTVYVLFAVIQFRYFFGNDLQNGFTYAEYARRGFFELMLVTMINWSLIMSCLKFVHAGSKGFKTTLKMMYSLLIVVSGIMLISAYQRLSMYEAAFGFTIDRILAHSFMIFLLVIFAYTLIKVWIEKLTLMHFYVIAGLIFYIALNAINIEQIIVDNNMERFEETGEMDIYYLNSLSYTGVDGLMELYKVEPDYPELRRLLQQRQQQVMNEPEISWQSYNFTRQEVTEKIKDLDLK
ncbi:DUF4153 domain-containing protein [Oceanobacillus damuensis]|uniref:DUF4153 domain-containing protein n=1 Tax=Oceanobacillus damuensis TaxID=937928 RepID=UPI000832A1E9|nr:DUF4173 domain-containing protein [Oceanobacillus damuensis]